MNCRAFGLQYYYHPSFVYTGTRTTIIAGDISARGMCCTIDYFFIYIIYIE